MKKPISLTKPRGSRKSIWLGLFLFLVISSVVVFFILRQFGPNAIHFMRLRQYWSDPEAFPQWGLKVGERCGDAPFLMPTDGFVAFFWGDRYATGKRHQGVDIFSPHAIEGIGTTPVIAVYDGYLTRLPEWRSAVILRIPKDPVQPGRQIWLFYTHMADAEGNSFIQPDYPPGTYERFVEAGTLLGYQGNYSADPDNPTGVHLHFSIVLDDGEGSFRNELEYHNTLDPSPYLGVELNGMRIGSEVAACKTRD